MCVVPNSESTYTKFSIITVKTYLSAPSSDRGFFTTTQQRTQTYYVNSIAKHRASIAHCKASLCQYTHIYHTKKVKKFSARQNSYRTNRFFTCLFNRSSKTAVSRPNAYDTTNREPSCGTKYPWPLTKEKHFKT